MARQYSGANFAECRSPPGVESFRGAGASFRSSRNLQPDTGFRGFGVLQRRVAAYTRRPIPSVYLARDAIRGGVSGASCVGHTVDQTAHPGSPPVQDVRVDHRGAHVAAVERLLNRPDVVGGSGVPAWSTGRRRSRPPERPFATPTPGRRWGTSARGSPSRPPAAR